jgi:hypothetical protein
MFSRDRLDGNTLICFVLSLNLIEVYITAGYPNPADRSFDGVCFQLASLQLNIYAISSLRFSISCSLLYFTQLSTIVSWFVVVVSPRGFSSISSWVVSSCPFFGALRLVSPTEKVRSKLKLVHTRKKTKT